jgi:dihydrolipoamide dehydrogenase
VLDSPPRFDSAKAKVYRDGVVQKNARGVASLMKKNGVETIRGRGKLLDVGVVEVTHGDQTRQLAARSVLLATGSVPLALPGVDTDGTRVLDSDQILESERVPESLVVVGGGAVGAEFASIFASLGTGVALVEQLDRLLPVEDEEVSAELARLFRRRGIDVSTGAALESVELDDSGVRVRVRSGGETRELETEQLLIAVGRRPMTEHLGLENLGIELDGRCVAVNQWMQTSVPSIYAIGDLVKTPWLAHVASAEGVLAVEHMAGVAARPLDYDRVPSCTYCEPEVASVGLTEAEARRRGYEVGVGRFPFAASGKASILGKTDGFVKLVRDSRYDELLGVHVIGAHATDLIAEACVALQIESTTEELFRTMHAHPTLSEAMAEAAQAALGRPIHF